MLKPGQWTDDASMGLCLADSLIALGGEFNGSDQRVRYWNWWFRGMNNSFRRDDERYPPCSVGLGGNISKSLYDIKRGTIPTAKYESDSEDAGIGSLMRLAAVPILYPDPKVAGKHAVLSSETTHPGSLAGGSCHFFAYLLSIAINWESHGKKIIDCYTSGGKTLAHPSESPKLFLDVVVDVYVQEELQNLSNSVSKNQITRLLLGAEPEESLERNWNWRSASLKIGEVLKRRGRNYNGYPVSAGYFGSFCLDGLAIALWSIYHSNSFGEALEKCINIRGDADSTGALVGQLAGAIYGFKHINDLHPKMLEHLNKWDRKEFAFRSVLLHYLSQAEFRDQMKRAITGCKTAEENQKCSVQ
jgi:ADP-ribosylglycohydrolase